MTAIYGRRWRLVLLWYLEACIAAAALWAVAADRPPRSALTVACYLALCGAALTGPGHIVRALCRAAGLSAARRRLVLQLFLALTAAATAATLSTQRGWSAIVCILMLGSALWALELDLRADAARTGRRPAA